MIKLKLLNCGLVTEAQEVDNVITDLINQFETIENIPEDKLECINKYETLVEKYSCMF